MTLGALPGDSHAEPGIPPFPPPGIPLRGPPGTVT